MNGSQDVHHIYNGPNRKKSEADGMKIAVHHTCHMRLHENAKAMQELKQKCQLIWMKKYGDEEAFRKRYGRSYL